MDNQNFTMGPTLRGLILMRINEIRATIGRDRFQKMKHYPFGYWPPDYDFSSLDDRELVRQFEMLVYRSYQQR